VEIVSGLQPAEAVLATKFDNLADGLLVKVIQAAGAEAKSVGPVPPKPASPPG